MFDREKVLVISSRMRPLYATTLLGKCYAKTYPTNHDLALGLSVSFLRVRTWKLYLGMQLDLS